MSKPLQSIKFPGLSEIYIIPAVPEIDATLSVSGDAADAAIVGQKLEELAELAASIDEMLASLSDLEADLTTHTHVIADVTNLQTQLDSLSSEIANKATTATYSADVTTNWTTDSTNGGYYQTVMVSGILATDNPLADVVLGDDIDANATYLEAWGCVTRITTAANSITLWANDSAPEVAFSIMLKVVR